jgi:hypothetical protein
MYYCRWEKDIRFNYFYTRLAKLIGVSDHSWIHGIIS